MKTYKLFFTVLLIFGISFQSCGPVIISSGPNHPTPSWFYPNRVVSLRYVYFPQYTMYYDLTLHNYLYMDNGIWVRVNVLPSRFNGINLKRSRQIHINDYFDDNIGRYHSKKRTNETRTQGTEVHSRRG